MAELENVSVAQSSLPHASQISLVDLLDRLLGTGVVLAGDVLISLAGVDLVQVRLHALITTVRADMPVPRNMRGEADG
jgi:hypothetical protein